MLFVVVCCVLLVDCVCLLFVFVRCDWLWFVVACCSVLFVVVRRLLFVICL